MKRLQSGFLPSIAVALFFIGSAPAFAQISLGTAQSFAALGGSTVTNTGSSVVTGNVGTSPGTSITGFPPGIVVGGAVHSADGVSAQAEADLTTAYNAVAGTPCNVDLTGQDLGGLTLTPNVYCFTSFAQLTGTLTLNMQGNPAAVFLFKIVSTLTTASGSSVLLINSGGTTCPQNIFWQVGSSAVLGTTTAFVGNIMADQSITLNTGATLQGRALARIGGVSLASNTINACAPAIACPLISVNPATLPNGQIGTAYSQAVTGSGGTAPYTYTVSSGSLPNGLLINSGTGLISGNPTTVGTFNFTITATDNNGCPGSRPYQIIIAAAGCPVVTLAPQTFPSGRVGTFYSQTVTASGGAAPFSYTIASGALPNGLSINASTGQISGTPTTVGLFNFTVQGANSGGCPGTLAYSIAIGAVIDAAGGPTLDPLGMLILIVLLAGAGLVVMNKLSM